MLIVLVFMALAIPLLASPFGLDWGYANAFAVKQNALECGALVLLVLLAKRGTERVGKYVAAEWLALAYGFYLAMNVLLRGTAGVSSAALFQMACCLMVFFGAAHVARQKDTVPALFTALACSGGVVSAWGLMQYLSGGEPYSTFGNRNLLAGFLIMALPMQILLIRQHLEGKKFIVAGWYCLLMILSFLALFACHSKAAWLAMAIAFAVWLAVMDKNKILLLGIALVVMVLFLPQISLYQELLRDVRPYLWKGALDMALAQPLWGWGLGTFFVYFPFYRPTDYFLMDKAADTTLHAHNELLQAFAESGWIGLLLFLALIVVAFTRVLRLARKHNTVPGVATTLLFVLSALLVKGFFDMDLRATSGQFLFWLVLGLAAGIGPVETSQKSGSRWLAVAAGFLAGFLFWQYTLPFARAEWAAKGGLAAQQRSDWPGAAAAFGEAMRIYPASVDFPFQRGYALARMGQWDEALASYAVVRSMAPFYSNVVFNMAAVSRQKGDYDAALRYLQEGFAVNPYSLPGHDIAREIFLLTGQPDKAKREEMMLRMIRSKTDPAVYRVD